MKSVSLRSESSDAFDREFRKIKILLIDLFLYLYHCIKLHFLDFIGQGFYISMADPGFLGRKREPKPGIGYF